MNRNINILLSLILLTLPLLAFSFSMDLNFENARYGAVVEIGPDETLKEEITAFGASIINKGEINGDFQAFGAEVFIPGTINGDLQAFGARVDIGGNISGNVEFACASLEIMGNINGKLTGGAAALTLSGNFGDDVDVGGAVVRISGNYNGDVKVNSDQIEISPDTNISGDFLYSADNIVIPEGAVISGEVKHFVPVEPSKEKKEERNPFLAYLFSVLWKIGVYFVIGLILWIVIPARYKTFLDRISDEPFKTLLWGVLGLIVLPILSIILMVTLIGMPSGIFIGLAYIILLYTSQVIGGTYIGHWILRLIKKTKEVNLFLSMLIGVIIYAIVASIPIFGWLVFFASAIFVFGSVLSVIWLLREKVI